MSGKGAFIIIATLIALQSNPSSATCKLKLLQQLALPAALPLPLPLPLALPPPSPPCLPLPLPLPALLPPPCLVSSCCGPPPTPLPVLQAPPITLPACEGPIITLPSPPIPSPKTIGHKCVCTKTVIKPQVVQRCISVPSVQRYLKTSFAPVLENIAYKATPKCPSPPACAPCAVC